MSMRHSPQAYAVEGSCAALGRARDRSRHRLRRDGGGASVAASCERLEDRRLLATFQVSNLADSGVGSLRQAIIDANASSGADAVVFAAGLSGTIPLIAGQLSITGQLTIDGPGAEQLAVSGSQLSRVFRISGGAIVSIDDLTITEGRAVGTPGEGAGILNVGSTLTLDRVVLSNNQAVGAATLSDARGGGVANISGSTLTVRDCLITGNQCLGGPRGRGFAAGILNFASSLTMLRSTIMENQGIGGPGGGPAPGGGVATLMGGATATIIDSAFIRNQAIGGDGTGGIGTGRGGGIYNNAATATIQNCSFIDNVARGGSNVTANTTVIGCGIGGGVFSGDAATLVLTDSVIKGNHAIAGDNNTSTGGNSFVGAAFGGGLMNIGVATVTNCVIEHNESRGGNGNQGAGSGTQFVGTGTGGGIHVSGGDPSGNPIVLNVQNSTVRFNHALGGSGNTAGTFINAGIGGGLSNNASNNNIPVSSGATVTLLNSTVAHNHAIGGDGGDGLGGGIVNLLGGVFNIAGSTVDRNHAEGGDAVAAVDGGDGFGGGIYNGSASTHSSNLGAPTVLRTEQSDITQNKAQGGESGGTGVGGGVYTLGQFDAGPFTVILKNKATTSDDDLFAMIL